jgi:tripartite-type tricarboxylate transporter receptor subunit TctC
MELFKQQAGLDILHVPFKGSGQAYPEVMAGRIELLIDPLFSTMPHLKGGKLKALAATAPKRSAIAPDIPAVAETLPGFNVQSMFGLVVSSGAPRDVVNKIYKDIVAVLKTPEAKKRMDDLGLETNPITPTQFDAYIKTEIQKWTGVVKAANVKLD